MRVLGVLGIVLPLAAPLGPAVVLQRLDRGRAPRVDQQPRPAVGRAARTTRPGPGRRPPSRSASARSGRSPTRSYSAMTVGPTGFRDPPAGSVETTSSRPVAAGPGELQDRPRVLLGREVLRQVVGEDVDLLDRPVRAVVRGDLEEDRPGEDARVDRQVDRQRRVVLGPVATRASRRRTPGNQSPSARGPLQR